MIRVFDFETTGFDPVEGAEVCELGHSDLLPDGTITDPQSQLFGISGKMPPDVRAVHHIHDDDLQGLPLFAPSYLGVAAVYAVHNAKFELQFITPPSPVICTYKAALRIWPNAPGHANFALAYWLEDQGIIAPLDRFKSQPAHRAGPDAYVTAHILKALFAKATADEMILWTSEPAVQSTIGFGKHRGQPWSEVDDGYLRWVMGQDFDEDTKWNVQRELDRR